MEDNISKQHIDRVITDLKNLIEGSLEDGKAEDVVTVNLKGKTDIADYMIVASGTSNKHTSVLAEKVIDRIKMIEPTGIASVEGAGEGSWVLVDVGDIIVHIFKKDVRELYNLEKMWAVSLPDAEAALPV